MICYFQTNANILISDYLKLTFVVVVAVVVLLVVVMVRGF
jgi:hypothetical protein